jgi:TP901 family phage tail tape measure protein
MGAPMDTAVRQFRQDQALAAQRHNANLAAARQMVQDRIRQNSALRNVAQTGYKGAMDDAVRNYKAVRAFAATQSKGAMDDAVRNFKRDQKIAADNHKKNLAAAKQMVAERLAVNERLATTATNKTLRDNMLRQMATSPAGVDAKRYQNAVVSMRNYVTAMDPAIQKTKDFIRMQNKLSKEIGAQREHSRRMAGDIGYRLDQTEKNLDAYFRAAFRLQMVGQRLINVGRSIQQFISGIMDTFGQFQYMLNRAGATLEVFTQKGEAGKIGLLDLQEGILQLSRSSMLLPAKDVAEAMYYWASATGQVIKTNEDLQNNLLALEPIMHVAVMTNTGYETAIKGVYSIISQFYNGAIDKATFVTEQLYYAAQKTAVEFEDLINSFKMVGPVARANNVTFEEMLNIFMQLGDVGIRGTMAGRALRQLFIQTAKPSKFAITEMKQMFGDDWFNKLNPGGHFVGALNYIKMIAKATLDWTEADRNHSIAQMTTANELPVVVALVGKYQRALLGLDTTMNKYVTTAEKARDYTKRGWETLQSSWIAVSGSLSRAWEHLQIQIGSTLADVLNPLVIKIRDIVEGIRLWAKANPDIVRALGQITALVGIIAAGSGIILTVIGSLLGIVTALVLVGKVVAPILAPVSAFIALIIGLGVAVIQNADYISARFREMSTIINATLKQNGQAVADFGNIFGEAAKLVSDILGIIVRTVADALPYIGRFIAMILDINKVIPILDALKVLLIAITANLIIRGLANLTMQFTGLNRVMRAFYVNNMLAYYGESTSRIGVLTMGVRGLAASFKGLLASLGPVGIAMAAISIAFAAYETNFGGFADFIDSITDKFRNLKDEVAALTADLGFFIGKDVERSIEKMISNLGGIKQSINAEGMVTFRLALGRYIP